MDIITLYYISANTSFTLMVPGEPKFFLKKEIIYEPPLFCHMHIKPPQNFGMFFALLLFLNLHQSTTSTLTNDPFTPK